MYLGFAVPTVVVLLATNHLTSGDIGIREFIGFLVGGLVLVVGGSLDDKFTLHPRVTFAFPLVAVAVATVAGIGISKLTNPFSVDPFVLTAGVSAAFTFVWLLVTTYTTKLLDGVDGVATGVTAIGCVIVSLFVTYADVLAARRCAACGSWCRVVCRLLAVERTACADISWRGRGARSWALCSARSR